MSNFFITGMGRSGTTLLEKLICNHTQLSILSQPFPFLFIYLKKVFLNSKGVEKYYVLNDSINNKNYDLDEFNEFLNSFVIDKDEIYKLFKSMNNYSGQKTAVDLNKLNLESNSFINIYNYLVNVLSNKKVSISFGSKEILCEEYMAHMINNGIKVILIIRDPRDVLASANYSKGEKYFGLKKPSLFILKTWRKSLEFMHLLADNENFHFLKYEDLVKHPYKELDKITNFLNVENFKINCFENGIFDQKGELWSANSSYEDSGSFISQKSVGAFKNILSEDEIAYTEVICKKEMSLLGYNFEMQKLNEIEIIQNFKDYNVENHQHLPANFSSQRENILSEIHRITN